MPRSRLLPPMLALLPVALAPLSAEAALEVRPAGLIYDSDQDITWLADANYAGTLFSDSGGNAGAEDGLFDWADANAWAADLVYGGVSGWRLPSADPDCAEDECPTAELGSLFYNGLGGSYDTPITDSHNAAFDLFTNLDDEIYWTSDRLDQDPSFAWTFDFFDGSQLAYDQGAQFIAWAVHDGDVGAVPVPVPAPLTLLAAGLFGLGLGRLRGRRRSVAYSRSAEPPRPTTAQEQSR